MNSAENPTPSLAQRVLHWLGPVVQRVLGTVLGHVIAGEPDL